VATTQASPPPRKPGGRHYTVDLREVDSGYSGARFAKVIAVVCGAKVEVVKRTVAGFQVLPNRWVVERTFGWLHSLSALE